MTKAIEYEEAKEQGSPELRPSSRAELNLLQRGVPRETKRVLSSNAELRTLRVPGTLNTWIVAAVVIILLAVLLLLESHIRRLEHPSALPADAYCTASSHYLDGKV